MEDNTVCVVNITTLSIYAFLKKDEHQDQLLERANKYRSEKIASWDQNRKRHPCKRFEEYYTESLNIKYELMTFSEFDHMQREFYLKKPLYEVSAETYDDMLNVLPPLKWCTIQGIEMFCMSEVYTGTFTTQYAKVGDKYYGKMVDISDKSTWIHNFMKDEVNIK